MTMGGKQILARESKKKNVGNHAFFKDKWATIIPNERMRSDSSQLFFRRYFYFPPAVFVFQCISVGYFIWLQNCHYPPLRVAEK